MEPSHTLAWILLVTAGWLRAVHTRDFTSEDIVLLHPSTTPYPGAFKCFTCQDAADNYECNRWAPDVYCPKETRYCYTRHTADTGGDSVSVTKRCVTFEECLTTGCEDVTDRGYQVCSSCCEGDICNLLVPRNMSGTILSSSSPLVSCSGGLCPVALSSVVIISVIISIFTARQMEVN